MASTFAKAQELLKLAMLATRRRGVSLDEIVEEFGCVHRSAQRMTVAQILSQSSNIGTVTLAQMLGRVGAIDDRNLLDPRHVGLSEVGGACKRRDDMTATGPCGMRHERAAGGEVVVLRDDRHQEAAEQVRVLRMNELPVIVIGGGPAGAAVVAEAGPAVRRGPPPHCLDERRPRRGVLSRPQVGPAARRERGGG